MANSIDPIVSNKIVVIWDKYLKTTILENVDYNEHKRLRISLGLHPDYNNGCRGCIKKAIKETYTKIKELEQ